MHSANANISTTDERVTRKNRGTRVRPEKTRPEMLTGFFSGSGH